MTKKEYDNYFLLQLPKMYESIPRLISRYKKQHLDVDTVVNETYLYCLEHINDFHTESKCQSYIFRFIDFNISRYNSKMNRTEKINNITENYKMVEEIDDSDIAIKHKISIEEWYNSRKSIISLYRQQLQDKEKIIIFDCYFVKEFQTGKAMGQHLGINKDYALKYIKQMKEDIINFEISQFVKNNI